MNLTDETKLVILQACEAIQRDSIDVARACEELMRSLASIGETLKQMTGE